MSRGRRLLGGIAAAALIVQPALAAAPVPPAPTPPGTLSPAGDAAAACTALKGADYSNNREAPTLIVNAVVKSATTEMPDLCLVNGRIAPTIGFRMWLPLSSWNGKYAQTGCGGRCGDLLDDGCQIVVARGYACLAADMGHKGTFYDDLWAIDNVQGDIDFGFRSTHVANLAGRIVTEAFYGAKPRLFYYFGASTGGRQGLIEAQRFPADFDGIVAGEPAMERPGEDHHNAIGRLRDSVSALNPGGKPLLTTDQVMMIHAAAVAKCDLDDRAADGFISDPRRCAFRPVQLRCTGATTATCLDDAQIAALDRVYANGAQPGSEKGWIGAYIGPGGTAGRYLFRLKTDYKYPYAWLFQDAANPDLTAFKARGGKLILYQGWADEATYPVNPPAYYETVERTMGGRAATQSFFRLFMIPGENHIPQVGGGAETVDYLSYLEAWVERGQAPDVLLAEKYRELARFAGPVTYKSYLRADNVAFSRPLYPYPVQAHYSGRGDVKDA
ncbi:MAG: tannase/feruloyl esterase family alpha/beta hydrolase, partial [Sphingomicrobium sp.]